MISLFAHRVIPAWIAGIQFAWTLYILVLWIASITAAMTVF